MTERYLGIGLRMSEGEEYPSLKAGAWPVSLELIICPEYPLLQLFKEAGWEIGAQADIPREKSGCLALFTTSLYGGYHFIDGRLGIVLLRVRVAVLVDLAYWHRRDFV